MSIVLNLPIVNVHYVENFIVTEISMTGINFDECFLKHDVCATLIHVHSMTVFYMCNSNQFCHFNRKHTVCFQDFVHSLGYSSNHATDKYLSFIHVCACGASKFQIYNVLICLVQKTSLTTPSFNMLFSSFQHDLLVLEVALDILAMQY